MKLPFGIDTEDPNYIYEKCYFVLHFKISNENMHSAYVNAERLSVGPSRC